MGCIPSKQGRFRFRAHIENVQNQVSLVPLILHPFWLGRTGLPFWNALLNPEWTALSWRYYYSPVMASERVQSNGRSRVNNPATRDAALTPYRVLDLTEGGLNWCGRVLADLGADVIKVEPPSGSPTRLRGPFYQDRADPEHSLFWYSYCLNKRGVTLDLESAEGRSRFKELAVASNIVLESAEPGYLPSLGVGYEELSKINPAIVMTSITPFGQTGPYAHYKATDIVAWSMGGMQWLAGDEDRPPVRISIPQAELHAGAQAAAASTTALWHSQTTGEGQHVDVSMQTAVIWTLMNATPFPHLHKVNLERAGPSRKRGLLKIQAVYPCKDGHISALLVGGVLGGSSMSE